MQVGQGPRAEAEVMLLGSAGPLASPMEAVTLGYFLDPHTNLSKQQNNESEYKPSIESSFK